MELVLNSKQVNTLRSCNEKESVEFGGILNSTYKNEINNCPRDPKSLFSVKKRLYKYQLRYSQNVEAILKLSIFTAILVGVLY